MYLMVGSRPDIAYATAIVSRSLENPTCSDWMHVKRIFRCLKVKGTIELGITFTANGKKKYLQGYSDAD